MKIAEVVSFLESVADPSLQESYDNAGLITGDAEQDCTGIICALDATEEVILEAISKNCNLVVAHHPIVFGGLKKITGSTYVEKSIISAIRNHIAIYAIHTNLDNVIHGVNGRIADRLELSQRTVLAPRPGTLKKLFTFVPIAHAEAVRSAIFEAGGGAIGNYSECSFNTEGEGTYKPGAGTHPFAGEPGKQHSEKEIRMEVIFPAYLENPILAAMKKAHPYEEVAYDVVPLSNTYQDTGSGLIGELKEPMDAEAFLALLCDRFGVDVVRHTAPSGRPVKRVAVCGGAGSFLISKAIRAGADAFVTADVKYHEFFDANGRIMICDIGHYESEQFTIALLQEVLAEKFPTFAVLKTAVKTNPVHYFRGPGNRD